MDDKPICRLLAVLCSIGVVVLSVYAIAYGLSKESVPVSIVIEYNPLQCIQDGGIPSNSICIKEVND